MPRNTTRVGDCTLYRGDVLEILGRLPEASVQTVITSPPYNQRIDTFRPSGMFRNSRWVPKISSGYFDQRDEEEYQRWQREVLAALYRVVAPGGSCFYNHKIRWRDGRLLHPLDLVRGSAWDLRQEIIWARNGSCTMNARMFAPNDERVYWLRKGRHRWNQSCVGYLSVWRIPSQPDPDHPCVFPEEIPRRCILATTSPGDVVLDCFCGAGTTGLACLATGRRFVGIELDPKYAALAIARWKERNQKSGSVTRVANRRRAA